MKKITLGFSILAASVIFLASCNKKVTEAPVADMEFETSVDAAYATSIVTDIDMICGFLGENAYPKFVAHQPGQIPVVVVNNTVSPYSASITWAPNTKCMDGKVRSGTIHMTYSLTDINSTYYRDYGFNGNLLLNNYVVDGWWVDDSVSLTAGQTRIKNLALTPVHSPSTTPLKWSVDGYFNIRNLADPSKKMEWVGTLYKTLQNTAQLGPNNLTAVNWSLAVIAYDGTYRGVTPGNVPFTFSVTPDKPLIKNYTCSPDKALGVSTTPSLSIINSEFHPFIGGVATFTTGGKEDPRLIDFGTEGTPCDNNGTITIKGITYKVDFKK